MSLTAWILDHRHTVWALVIATVILGVVSYRQLPVRLFPDTAPPLVNVITMWPGASASDVAADLSRELEEEFAALEGVVNVRSTSQDNLSMISVEFEYDVDGALAAVDVQNGIARLGSALPEGALDPQVVTFSTSDKPVYSVAVSAEDMSEARRIAEDIVAPRLQQVSGVATVDVFGGHERATLIEVEPSALEAHGVPMQAVARAVQEANTAAPAGRLRGASRETMLRVDERAARPVALADVPVPMPDGTTLHVRDFASVERAALDDDAWFSVNGRDGIAVQVFRSEDANTVEVVRDVQGVIASLESELSTVTFSPGEESASFTEVSVSNLLENVWQALALAALVLFLFLGRVRTSIVTILSMPLAYGLTFGGMRLVGLEFNMVTLSAVILAVGMVVDASVVVLENIVRLRDEEGLDAEEAAIRGTDEVQLPVLAGAATTLIVLVPLLGLTGFVGKTFGPLALTLIIAFTSSVGVALVVVPVLSMYAKDGGRVDAIAAWLTAPFQRGMEWLRGGYLALLDLGLRHRVLTLSLAFLVFVLGAAGLAMRGMDMLPRMDSGSFLVSVEMSSGTALAGTRGTVQEIERFVQGQPEVVLTQSQAGFESGMHFSGGSGVLGSTQGLVSVTLSPRTEREASIWEVEQRVRDFVRGLPGVSNVVVVEVGSTAKPTTLAPLVARLSGPDPLVLDALGDDVRDRLVGVPGVVQPYRRWRRDLERVRVVVDEERAARVGATPRSVSMALAAGAEGIPAGELRVGLGTPEPVLVRMARPESPRVEDMLGWPLVVPGSGQVIPLRAIAELRPEITQGLFSREDLATVLEVLALIDGRPLNFAVADAATALEGVVLPQGYRLDIVGENADLADARGQILGTLAISVVAVYLLLVSQFRSFIHPITVMMAVPLSLAGVSLALWLSGKPVSMPVMVGLVLLVGTVVNNAILLVDVVRERRREGMERQTALREGVRARFRPILMTSLSTIIGMIPLHMEWALGAERFSPLATAVIGGLTASTLLTLVVIPVLYDTMESALTWRGASPRRAGAVIATVLAAGLTAGSSLAQAAEPIRTLDEAWTVALGANPGVEALDHQVEAARAQLVSARGRMLPAVELQARYSRLSEVPPAMIQVPIQLPDGSFPDPIQLGESIEEQSALGLAVTQPVFAGGALYHGRRAASATLERREAERDVGVGTLREQVAEAWYGLWLATELVDVQGRALASLVERQARMERLVGLERATRADLATVSLRRAEVAQELLTARSREGLARARLRALLDAPGDVDFEPAAPTVDPSWLTPSEEEVFESSPALQVAWSGERAALAQARARYGLLGPQVALRFGADYANPNSRYFPATAEWNDSWDASVVIRWNLDMGIGLGEARRASAEASAASARVRQVELETALVHTAVAEEIALAAEQIELARERVALAGEARAATERAQEERRATISDLLDRDRDLAQAEAAHASALVQHALAVERAEILTGPEAQGPPVYPSHSSSRRSPSSARISVTSWETSRQPR